MRELRTVTHSCDAKARSGVQLSHLRYAGRVHPPSPSGDIAGLQLGEHWRADGQRAHRPPLPRKLQGSACAFSVRQSRSTALDPTLLLRPEARRRERTRALARKAALVNNTDDDGPCGVVQRS